jgi:hypothetical protein
MLWAKLDVDAIDDPVFIKLRRKFGRGAFEMWIRVIQFAKKANQRGEVLLHSGEPCTAEHFTDIHEQWLDPDEELVRWTNFLEACINLGLLWLDGNVLCVVDWRRWHCKPSDEPEAVRERVAAHRKAKNDDDVTRCNAMYRDVTRCNAPPLNNENHVTPVTRVTPQIRSEQSKVDQRREEQNREEKIIHSFREENSEKNNVEREPTHEGMNDDFFSQCSTVYKELCPSSIFGDREASKAQEFRARNIDKVIFGILPTIEEDLIDALRLAVDPVGKFMASNPGKVSVPWSVLVKEAQNKLADAIEGRIDRMMAEKWEQGLERERDD